MALTLSGGVSIQTVDWVITGQNNLPTVVLQGSVNVHDSSSISFLIGGIPAGSGYEIALSGTSADGLVTCSGSAQFSITVGYTTKVSDLLQCDGATPQGGSAAVVGATYDCAAWEAVAASPSEATLGNSVALTVTATAANPGAITYAWSAPTGVFSSPSSSSTSFTCTTPGMVLVTLALSDGPVPEGGVCNPELSTASIQVTCDATSSPSDVGAAADGADAAISETSEAGAQPLPFLVTTVDPGVVATPVTINQGTAIGQGAANGATPFMLANLAADPNNAESILETPTGDFSATGSVPDVAAGFCNYPESGAPKRISYITGATFETSETDPRVLLTPADFPLVYTTTNTPTGNAFGGQPPIIGLFDWRPKDLDEALLVAESDDNGKSWYFMQNVLELDPDYTNPNSGGFSSVATSTGCPATLQSNNANFTSASGSEDDDGWGHASIIQLPGPGNAKTGQFLYMLDRNPNDIPGQTVSIVDNAPLRVIHVTGAGDQFPIWSTDNTNPGANDIKSISTALVNTPDAGANAIDVESTVGLSNPDGIMAVFPTPATAAAGSPVTVLYVQKIVDGDDTGSTALPVAERCTAAPFSGKTNDDISNVRLATTTDGIHFTDLGVVQGLNDPTTVDYNETRWISPRGTLLDIQGDGSLWGLYFAGGNCLDGDSDAFHYIGYAESTDQMHWVVYRDINHPIASINPITTTNQLTGATVTIPANPPLIPTQDWFAERLYAPTATQIDATHLSMTFAGYGAQNPNDDLLEYRQIGNVVLTVSRVLPAGVPNNINTH
jgi:hypothetical protein